MNNTTQPAATKVDVFMPQQYIVENGDIKLNYGNRIPMDTNWYLMQFLEQNKVEQSATIGQTFFAYLFRRFGATVNRYDPNFLATYTLTTPYNGVYIQISCGINLYFQVLVDRNISNLYLSQIQKPLNDWHNGFLEFCFERNFSAYTKSDIEMALEMKDSKQAQLLLGLLKEDILVWLKSLPFELQESYGFDNNSNALDSELMANELLITDFLADKNTKVAALVREYSETNPQVLDTSSVENLHTTFEALHSGMSLDIHNAIKTALNALLLPLTLQQRYFNIFGYIQKEAYENSCEGEVIICSPHAGTTGSPYIGASFTQIKEYNDYLSLMNLVYQHGKGDLVAGLNKVALPLKNAATHRKKNVKSQTK